MIANIRLTSEQKAMCDSLMQGYHVDIRAFAGTGKSTSTLSVINQMAQQRRREGRDFAALMLTYNNRLNMETRHRIIEEGGLLASCTKMLTFHGFAVRYFREDGDERFDDTLLADIATRRILPKIPYAFDLIVIDEYQDATPAMHAFMRHAIASNARRDSCQLCVCGDPMQNIYGYKGATATYLENAEKEFGDLSPNKRWAHHTFTITKRSSKRIVDFVREVLLDGKIDYFSDKEASDSDDGEVTRVVCDIYRPDAVVSEIADLIEKRGVSPDNIAVLAYSLSADRAPTKFLENAIARRTKYMCYVPMSDDGNATSSSHSTIAMCNKIAFSTFHQGKGREWDYVFMMIDDSYYDMDLSAQRGECSNCVYVGGTRARKGLFIIESHKRPPLSCMNLGRLKTMTRLSKYSVDKDMRKGYRASLTNDKVARKEFNVTGLCRHLSETALVDALGYLDVVEYEPNLNTTIDSNTTTAPTLTETKRKYVEFPPLHRAPMNNYEEVSDINGVAATIILDLVTNSDRHMDTKFLNVLERLDANYVRGSGRFARVSPAVRERVREIWGVYFETGRIESLSDILFCAAAQCTVEAGYVSRMIQLGHSFDWLTRTHVDQIVETSEALGVNAGLAGTSFESFMKATFTCRGEDRHGNGNGIAAVMVKGFADIINPDGTIVEVKCTSGHSAIHIVQAAIYACIAWKQIMDDTVGSSSRVQGANAPVSFDSIQPPKCRVVNIALGRAFDIRVKDPQKFMERLISDKAFRATHQ